MKSLSLYIHIPFCSRSCPYCTFYHVAKSPAGEIAFVKQAAGEIESELSAIEERCSGGDHSGDEPPLYLKTVYVGGGTPSILRAASIESLIEPLSAYAQRRASEERTIELNPEDITREDIDNLDRLGFDRVSVGVQSMSRRAQQALGRSDPRVNRAALESVAGRFGNFNVDLLLGIPGGTVAEVTGSAEALFCYRPTHFSVYCLEGAGEGPDGVRTFLSGVDQEEAAAEYLALCDLLEERGYIHYEVSNFALPGFESKHNLAYWEGGDYLGIGPAAHSFIDGIRWFNQPSLESYLAVRNNDFASVRSVDAPGPRERELERLFLGLRTNRGVPVDAIPRGHDLIEALIANGFANILDERLILTDRGFLLLDEIVLRLAGSGNGIDRKF